MYLKEKRAQVSFEYLLTIVFAIVLVAIVTVFAMNMSSIGEASQNKIKNYKQKYFEDVFG